MGDWEWEKINPIKIRANCYTKSRAKVPLNYKLMGKVIPQTSSCKYLVIILCSDLSWADQANYTVKKTWKALHFTMRILKKGHNTRSLAYRSLARPILEYRAACWDPYREGHIKALDRVKKRAKRFAQNANGSGRKRRRHVESYHAFVHYLKRTTVIAHGKPWGTDLKCHTFWVGQIMNRKLGIRSKGRI